MVELYPMGYSGTAPPGRAPRRGGALLDGSGTAATIGKVKPRRGSDDTAAKDRLAAQVTLARHATVGTAVSIEPTNRGFVARFADMTAVSFIGQAPPTHVKRLLAVTSAAPPAKLRLVWVDAADEEFTTDITTLGMAGPRYLTRRRPFPQSWFQQHLAHRSLLGRLRARHR